MKKYIIILLCCLLIPWSVEAKDKEINLEYKPKEKVKVNPKNVPPVKIYFEIVEDSRSQPREIGENQEDKGKKIKIVTSKDDGAGKFLLSVLKNEFRDKGFKVEDSSGEALKIISSTLLKFWTIEESRYNSEAQLRVEVRDKIGEGSFKKTYSGKGTNSGRSLSEGNYNETFSDALARMVENIFSDSEFLTFLSEKPKPPRVEEKQIEGKRGEEKKLEELKAVLKRLEEIKAEEKRAKEIQEEEKRAEEKRLKEIKAEEKRLEELKVGEKRLEEIRTEVKRLEEKKAEEKRAEEKRLEELKAEEKRLEEIKAEVKRLEELKALKEGIIAEEKRAKEKRPAPAKPKPVDPVFGPK